MGRSGNLDPRRQQVLAAMRYLSGAGLAGLILGLVLPLQAIAEPVEIQARTMALNHAKATVEFKKDVRLVQGDFELHCDRLIGHYNAKGGNASELQRADAYGHVTIRHNGTTGHADKAQLDNVKGQVVLIGHAVLEQEGRRIEGNEITHNLRQQNTAVNAEGGSRVRMTIESGKDSKSLIPDKEGSSKP